MAIVIAPRTEQESFHTKNTPVIKARKGLTRRTVEAISAWKEEPAWMCDQRLRAYETFRAKRLPAWGGNLTDIDFQDIYYFLRPTEEARRNWEDVDPQIKRTFDRLGVPDAERKFLAGVSAQFESEVVYHNLQGMWEKQGVIFTDMDTALRKYPEMVREHFGTVVPAGDNVFAALNSAVWSGGSFVYVPKGVHVEIPLQAYFRINAKKMGQFERTLIIAEEGSSVHYVEGCTAPTYSSDSLHSAVVEIIVRRGAKVRYTTIQNWSKNVYNLVTKRAFVDAEGTMEWIDGNLGSKLTMKYPSVYLRGPGAHGEVLSIALAGDGQHQDAGAKAIHLAPNTTSRIVSKSISIGSGRTSYRGLLKIAKGARGARSSVQCDALLLAHDARSDTYPTMDVREPQSIVEHEATVARIGEEQLVYLQSRGLTPAQAAGLIVRGFVDPFVQQLPMEYAVELNRLIDLEMEGSVG